MYKKTFDTPFEQYAEHHGKEFTVVAGPLDGSDGTTVITLDEMRAQLEACGDQPTFAIRLSTGELISAFPEEVLAEYEWEFNPNSPPGDAATA